MAEPRGWIVRIWEGRMLLEPHRHACTYSVVETEIAQIAPCIFATFFCANALAGLAVGRRLRRIIRGFGESMGLSLS